MRVKTGDSDGSRMRNSDTGPQAMRKALQMLLLSGDSPTEPAPTTVPPTVKPPPEEELPVSSVALPS